MDHPESSEIQALIADLKDSCLAADGIGLAAPQLGVLQRVVVINYPRENHPYGLINPEIIWASSGTSPLEEGCLSIPDVHVRVTRPSKVKIQAFDEKGRPVEIVANDLLAKILQHEIDHLNGVLITDYGPAKREEATLSQGPPETLLNA